MLLLGATVARSIWEMSEGLLMRLLGSSLDAATKLRMI